MQVDLEAGTARVEAESEGFDPRQLPEAVRKVGFTPGPIQLVAVGEVKSTDTGRVLALAGPWSALPLVGEGAESLEVGPGVRVEGELIVPEEHEEATDGAWQLRVEE